MRKSQNNFPILGDYRSKSIRQESPTFKNPTSKMQEEENPKIKKFSSTPKKISKFDENEKISKSSKSSKGIQSNFKKKEFDAKLFYTELKDRMTEELNRQADNLEASICQYFPNMTDEEKISVKTKLEKYQISKVKKLQKMIKALHKYFHVNFRIKNSDLRKEKRINFIENELKDPRNFEEKVKILKEFLKKKTQEAQKLKKIDLFEKATRRMDWANKKIMQESLGLTDEDVKNVSDIEMGIERIKRRNDKRMRNVQVRINDVEKVNCKMDAEMKLIEEKVLGYLKES